MTNAVWGSVTIMIYVNKWIRSLWFQTDKSKPRYVLTPELYTMGCMTFHLRCI